MAAGSRYRPISRIDFAAAMDAMGFSEVPADRAMEHVYERAVTYKDGTASRFRVRIFSSVHVTTGWTRECGGDAIRVLLLDTNLPDRTGQGKIVNDWTVYRTENALDNTRLRAREAWAYAADKANGCSCGALMTKRDGRDGPFMGCTSYPACKRTRDLVCDPVRGAA